MDDFYEPYHPNIAAVTSILIAVVLVFFILTMFLLLQRDFWHLPVHILAANSMIGHIVFTLILHSTSIHLELLYKPLGKVWCWLNHHSLIGYVLITPYTLFMYTVERLIYIRNPTTHSQKFGRVSIVIMLVLPWIMTVILGFLLHVNLFVDPKIVLEHESDRRWNENVTVPTCVVIQTDVARLVVPIIVGSLVPILGCLIISIVVLCMWCCYKRKHSRGTNYALMGEPVEKAVRDSVIAVSLLNFLYVVIFVFEASVGRMYVPIPGTSLTLYGVIEGIVFISTLGKVREKIVTYCGRCCRRRGENPPVSYNKDDEENVDL